MNKKHIRRAALSFFVILIISNSSVLFTFAQESDKNLDSDGDGLTDWDEENRYYSDPDNTDTDGDSIDDGREVRTGTSPLLTDSDGDHLTDNHEYANWDPLATRREDRYVLCPYIADLPNLNVEIADDEVRTAFEFKKGNEYKYEAQTTSVSELQIQSSWGSKIEMNSKLWAKAYAQLGIKSGEVDAKVMGTGTGFQAPQPYFEVVTEAGVETSIDAMSFFETQGSLVSTINWQGSRTAGNYINSGWDMTSATIAAELKLTNTFSRLVKLENIIFDIGIGRETYQSVAWSEGEIELPKGQSYTFEITFDISGQSWVYILNTAPMLLSINPNYLQLSVWADGDWVSSTGIQNDVQEQCAQVEVVGEDWGVSKYITANVDKIDGLNILDALDRLYVPYTYKYGRMIDIMGQRSTPGEKVWTFAYFETWYDAETLSPELNFQSIRMYSRGALTVDMQKDTDGDWLTDNVEIRIGTNSTNPDSDGDFADDYVEIVLMESNALDMDTDGGGTIDGIEYYEHLNASDSSDDYFDYPDWYKNHQTIQAARTAADLLLENAIIPDENMMTWVAPTSSVENNIYHYDGQVTYVSNETLLSYPSESILCAAVGDADNDNDNDIVLGTYPHGLVLLLENLSGVLTLHDPPLANMSNTYGIYPTRVMDIAIADVENSGDNSIVFGTSYYDSAWIGGLYILQESGGWLGVQNIEDDIPGGIYSIAIGNVNFNADNELVAGIGSVEALDTGSVVVYSGDIVHGWSKTIVAVRDSSRVYVTIGDFADQAELVNGIVPYDNPEIVFCTYDDNSTLGWIGWDANGYDWLGNQRGPSFVGYDNYTLSSFTNYGSDPWEKYMWVALGDSDGDGGLLELATAIDREAVNNDSIKLDSFTIIEDVEFVSDEFIFDDFDNDGWDEVVYHYADAYEWPTSYLEIYEWNGTDHLHSVIESPVDPLISSMAAGDANTDGEIELIYGTQGGLVRFWSHPQGAIWMGEYQEWSIDVTVPEPWIYQGEAITIDVDIHNFGDYQIEDLVFGWQHIDELNNQTDSSILISDIQVGSDNHNSFLFWPLSTDNYTLQLSIESISPRVSHYSEYQILVRPRTASQTKIGQTFLDLYTITGNATYLDAAKQVFNWLYDVKVEVGSLTIENAFYSPAGNNYGWNGDANMTDHLLPGNLLATVETARFMLNLFRTTYESDPYLLGAVGAGYYLANSCMYLDTNLRSPSWTHEGILEAAAIGEYLMDLNEEFLFDLYGAAVKGLANYLVVLSQDGPALTNWFDEPGLTKSAACFLARVPLDAGDPDYVSYAEGALAWLEDYVGSEYAGLDSGVTPDDPYQFYEGSGLAGIALSLSELRNILEVDISGSMETIADEILSRKFESNQGINWHQPYWTDETELMANSATWFNGSSGIGAALAEAYRDVGDQSYRLDFLNVSIWLEYCIDSIGAASEYNAYYSEVLADSIASLIHMRSVLPVIFVGYFVDPMTSLSAGEFVLSGYVQSVGWHADGVSLTADLPEVFLLPIGQTEKIVIGTISEPQAVVVTWDITFLVYGNFELSMTGNSTNAGSQINTARLRVTDLGVDKIPEVAESAGTFAALSIPGIYNNTLFNLGESVLIPVEALYADTGLPAYNASISVGDYGTCVVNGSGEAYMRIEEFEPGTKDIPITIRYDKESGITDGTHNLTLSLTFSSLEIHNTNISTTIAQAGQTVIFKGRVLYSHDGSAVGGATVALNGAIKTVTSPNGYFTFEHTEITAGTMNYTVTATSDGINRIVVSSLSKDFQITWVGFWTPLNIALVIGGIGILAVVVVFGIRRIRTPAEK